MKELAGLVGRPGKGWSDSMNDYLKKSGLNVGQERWMVYDRKSTDIKTEKAEKVRKKNTKEKERQQKKKRTKKWEKITQKGRETTQNRRKNTKKERKKSMGEREITNVSQKLSTRV